MTRRLKAPVCKAMSLAISLAIPLALPSAVFAAPVPPPPSAPVAEPAPTPEPAPTENMSEEEKMERAKTQYVAAEALAAQGKWVEAVPLYEEAYYLVPGKHGFAHKVGVAAFYAGDCDKANSYLKHFLTYGDPEKHGDKIDEAKQILGEISVSGCATEEATATTTTTKASATDEEDPLDASTREQRQDHAAESRKAKKDEKRGLLIGGAVLTSIGVVGVVSGVIAVSLASSTANSLDALSTNMTTVGFPVGDYACRGVEASQCPYKLEAQLQRRNIVSYVGLGVGGAALIGGAAMLAIYSINKKSGGEPSEGGPVEGEAGVELTGIAPMLMPGGGGGAMVELRF